MPFHEPIAFVENPVLFRPWPVLRCPIIWERQRYAILWSGMSNKRHLNDMEFLYRTLIDRYGFRPDHIYAMSYDGSLNTQDGVQTSWPGDGTGYRINLTGEGTRSDFEAAVDELKGRIDSDDLLLVHINNHGGYDGTPGTANFCTYPSWAGYYASDFAAKLGELPKFDKLIAMLEPCHAGGFNAPIIAHSTADATSVASAALEPYNSYVSADVTGSPRRRATTLSAPRSHSIQTGTPTGSSKPKKRSGTPTSSSSRTTPPTSAKAPRPGATSPSAARTWSGGGGATSCATCSSPTTLTCRFPSTTNG